jgi:hypothetical protein
VFTRVFFFKGVLQAVLWDAMVGSQNTPERRCSKNSGGGIAPAAIEGLIEGASCTVNAFQPARLSGKGTGNGA